MARDIVFETLEEVPAALADYAVEVDGGGYKVSLIDSSDIEEKRRLTSTVEALRGDLKKAKGKLSQAEIDANNDRSKALEDQGKYKELYEKERADRQAEREKLLSDNENVRKKAFLDLQVAKFNPVDDERASMLRGVLEGLSEAGEDGGYRFTVDDISSHVSEKYNFLLPGNQSSGGGAGGGSSNPSSADLMSLPPRERINAAREAQNK